jgi:hypothetical protein
MLTHLTWSNVLTPGGQQMGNSPKFILASFKITGEKQIVCPWPNRAKIYMRSQFPTHRLTLAWQFGSPWPDGRQSNLEYRETVVAIIHGLSAYRGLNCSYISYVSCIAAMRIKHSLTRVWGQCRIRFTVANVEIRLVITCQTISRANSH